MAFFAPAASVGYWGQAMAFLTGFFTLAAFTLRPRPTQIFICHRVSDADAVLGLRPRMRTASALRQVCCDWHADVVCVCVYLYLYYGIV